MVRKSDVVITICQELQDTVTDMGVGDRSLLIENVMGGDVDEPPSRSPAEVRAARGALPADAPLALYTGTFEAYQGVDMLIDAVGDRRAVASGCARAGRRRRAGAGRGGTGRARMPPARQRVMVFTGQQPAREIPGFVQAADLLVSPRIRGTNTPLKIYSYLRSGKPIVATNLLTHTQVLTPEIARLVEPQPEPFAAGDARAASSAPTSAQRLSAAARRGRAATSTARESYLRRTARSLRAARPVRPAARPAHRVALGTGRGAQRPVKVLVTGATGFTGGHLAQHLAGARRRRCGRWCGRRAARASIDRRWPRPASTAVDGDLTDRRRRCARAVRGRRGRVSHRRDVSRSRAARLGVSRDQRRRHAPRARGGASAAGVPARRALQHRRRARPHRASAGERGRAVQSRRRLSGNQARGRAAGARVRHSRRASTSWWPGRSASTVRATRASCRCSAAWRAGAFR